MSSWQIRDARPGDAAGIGSVHAAAWEGAYRGVLSEAVIRSAAARRLSWWTEYMREPHEHDHVLVATERDRVLGFALGKPSPDDEAEPDQAEVGGLYVKPDAWGRGIGGDLLHAVLERLRAAGFTRATLWVLAENAAARRFYERRGWAPDGAERVDPGRGARELRYRIGLD